MFSNDVLNKTEDFCCRYLSSLTAGPWTIQGACITVRTETGYRVTTDSQIVRLLIEKPQAWAVAFEVTQRGGTIQRIRVEGYDGVADARGADEVQRSYLRWLDCL